MKIKRLIPLGLVSNTADEVTTGTATLSVVEITSSMYLAKPDPFS